MTTASDLAAVARQARVAKAQRDLLSVQSIIASLSTRAQAAAKEGRTWIEISVERERDIFNAVMTPKGVEFLSNATHGFVVKPDADGNSVRIYWDDPAAEFTPVS